MKKTFIIIVLVILLTSLIGCGGGGATHDADGNEILTVMLYDRNNVPSSEGTLTDTRWTRYIQEAMKEQGIAVEFKTLARQGATEKLITMLGSNSAPDLIFLYERSIFLKIAEMDGMHDLTPYLDEYGQEIKNVLGDDLLSIGNVNGKQIGIPAMGVSDVNHNTFVRQDWLDILGMDAPTNRDELVDVLMAIKTNDPGNVGMDRLIPYQIPNVAETYGTSSTMFDLLGSFLERSDELSYKLPNYKREGFYDYMSFLNDIYNAGLAHTEFATYSHAKNLEQQMQGIVGIYDECSWVPPRDNYLETLYSNVPDAKVVPTEVYQNDDGSYYKQTSHGNGFYIMSPKTSDRPEAVIKYLNWLAQEETYMTLGLGIEDEHYEIIDGAPISIDIEYNKQTLTYNNADFNILVGPSAVLTDEQKNTQMLLQNNPHAEFEAIRAEVNSGGRYFDVVFNEPIPTENKVLAQLYKICDEYWVKMIQADDFDAVYNKFMEEIDNLGVDSIIAERQAYYDKYVN